jgi:hypothetical protein
MEKMQPQSRPQSRNAQSSELHFALKFCYTYKDSWARSSSVERDSYKVDVDGPTPSEPTN